LRRIWSDDVVEFKGKYHNIPASKINPKPLQTLGGGFTPNTFSRIIRYDLNGWMDWIARNMPEVPIDIMDQYYPDNLCDSIDLISK
jgi:hypothetical protein